MKESKDHRRASGGDLPMVGGLCRLLPPALQVFWHGKHLQEKTNGDKDGSFEKNRKHSDVGG